MIRLKNQLIQAQKPFIEKLEFFQKWRTSTEQIYCQSFNLHYSMDNENDSNVCLRSLKTMGRSWPNVQKCIFGQLITQTDTSIPPAANSANPNIFRV